jgi:hypothetical protein
MKTPLVLLLLAVPGAAAHAGGLEIAGHGGPVIPVYDQSLRIDPSFVLPGGTPLPRGQELRLEARGGTALGAALTLYLADAIGFEARLDTADLKVESEGARYTVTARNAPPLPDATAVLELGAGPMDIERVRPLSLNLKLRTPGAIRLALSGGVSYLPELRFVSAQAVRLRLTELLGVPANLELASFGLRAEALPDQRDSGRWGVNAGAGLQIRLGRQLWLVGEGRGFFFQRHRLHWRRDAARPLTPLEQTLAQEIERRLDPLDFNPTFVQATAGLALSF